jgi:hypothetical protein
MIEAEPSIRNGAHNRHTGCLLDQVLSGSERGVIDLGVSVPMAARHGSNDNEKPTSEDKSAVNPAQTLNLVGTRLPNAV